MNLCINCNFPTKEKKYNMYLCHRCIDRVEQRKKPYLFLKDLSRKHLNNGKTSTA